MLCAALLLVIFPEMVDKEPLCVCVLRFILHKDESLAQCCYGPRNCLNFAYTIHLYQPAPRCRDTTTHQNIFRFRLFQLHTKRLPLLQRHVVQDNCAAHNVLHRVDGEKFRWTQDDIELALQHAKRMIDVLADGLLNRCEQLLLHRGLLHDGRNEEWCLRIITVCKPLWFILTDTTDAVLARRRENPLTPSSR